MSGPLISHLPLWERHEQRVLAILRSALVRFSTKNPAGDENSLNGELYDSILEVNGRNQASGGDDWFDYPPILDSPTPPTPGTHGSPIARKRPDLQWGYIDHQAKDRRRGVRNFVIECKRLGVPSRSGWAFNVHYVDDGVHRFVDAHWSYGEDVATGAMVGYVESSTLAQIVADVNRALKPLGVLALTLPPGTGGPLTEMAHQFGRSFAISPFRLVHLWIDIR